jgi:hypothetical protein
MIIVYVFDAVDGKTCWLQASSLSQHWSHLDYLSSQKIFEQDFHYHILVDIISKIAGLNSALLETRMNINFIVIKLKIIVFIQLIDIQLCFVEWP